MILQKHIKLALPSFLVPFIVYCFTLAPSVVGGDSAELTNVALDFGVAHPPGYPLFTLLAYLFSFFPFAEPAQAVNLFSAFCSAGAALFITLTLINVLGESKKGLFAAYLASAFFAFAPWIWSYSVVAEVFALNNLLVSVLLLLSCLFWKLRKEEHGFTKNTELCLLAIAFVMGLAACNHHIAALFAIPLAVLLIVETIKLKPSFRFWLKIVGVFVLGLTPYLQIVVAPLVNGSSPFLWGNTASWNGFWNHFFRSDYGTFQLGHQDLSGETSFLAHFMAFFKDFSISQSLIIGLPLVFLGFRQLHKSKQKKINLTLAIGFLFYILVFFNLANFSTENALDLVVMKRFWQQPYLFLTIWMGIGFYSFLERRKDIYSQVGFAVVCIALIGFHYQASSQKNNLLIRQMTESTLKSLPENSILFTSGDHLSSSFAYVKDSVGIGKSVELVNSMMLVQEWYVKSRGSNGIKLPGHKLGNGTKDFTLRKLLAANSGAHQIFVVNDFRVTNEPLTPFKSLPMGWVDHIVAPDATIDFIEWKNKNIQLFADVDQSTLISFPNGSWEFELYRLYWRQYYKFAANMLVFALKEAKGTLSVEEAANHLEKVEPHLFTAGRPLFQQTKNFFDNLRIAYKNMPQTPEVQKKLAALKDK